MQTSNAWRIWLVVLVLANMLLWAWTQGYLMWLGTGPTPVQEPHRLEQQLKPDGLTVRQTDAQKAPTPASD